MAEVTPSSVDAVREAVGDLVDREIIVVSSSMGFGKPPVPRVGVLAVNGPRPEVLWVGFLSRDDVVALAESLVCSVGGWDAMFATGWSRAWVGSAEGLRLWGTDGLLAQVGRDAVDLGDRRFEVDVDHVDTYAGPGWVERGVRVVPFEDEAVVLTRMDEPMAEADPTYDRVDLEGDAGWAVDLGAAVAEVLGVPHFVSWR